MAKNISLYGVFAAVLVLTSFSALAGTEPAGRNVICKSCFAVASHIVVKQTHEALTLACLAHDLNADCSRFQFAFHVGTRSKWIGVGPKFVGMDQMTEYFTKEKLPKLGETQYNQVDGHDETTWATLPIAREFRGGHRYAVKMASKIFNSTDESKKIVVSPHSMKAIIHFLDPLFYDSYYLGNNDALEKRAAEQILANSVQELLK